MQKKQVEALLKAIKGKKVREAHMEDGGHIAPDALVITFTNNLELVVSVDTSDSQYIILHRLSTR